MFLFFKFSTKFRTYCTFKYNVTYEKLFSWKSDDSFILFWGFFILERQNLISAQQAAATLPEKCTYLNYANDTTN